MEHAWTCWTSVGKLPPTRHPKPFEQNHPDQHFMLNAAIGWELDFASILQLDCKTVAYYSRQTMANPHQ
eukprot:1490558-Amphidinium_carterae.1